MVNFKPVVLFLKIISLFIVQRNFGNNTFHIETSHSISSANNMTGFFYKTEHTADK